MGVDGFANSDRTRANVGESTKYTDIATEKVSVGIAVVLIFQYRPSKVIHTCIACALCSLAKRMVRPPVVVGTCFQVDPAFAHFTNLTELDLGRNRLQSLGNLPDRLVTLSCAANELSGKVRPWTSVVRIYICGDEIRENVVLRTKGCSQKNHVSPPSA